jgi:hypothetical protein
LPQNELSNKAQAEKAAAGAGGGFSFFGGRQEKWENAADLYTQAANAFRLQKQGNTSLQDAHTTKTSCLIFLKAPVLTLNRQRSRPGL